MSPQREYEGLRFALKNNASVFAEVLQRAGRDKVTPTDDDLDHIADNVVELLAGTDLEEIILDDKAVSSAEHRSKVAREVTKTIVDFMASPEEVKKPIADAVGKIFLTEDEARRRRMKKRLEEAKKRLEAAKQIVATNPARLVLGSPTGSMKQYKRLGKAGKQSKPLEVAYSQPYEYGEIRVRPLDKSIDPGNAGYPCTYYAADIFVAAIKCFGSEDPGGIFSGGEGEDEPYLLMSVISPASIVCGGSTNSAMTWRSQVFEGIEKGEIFGQEQLVFENVVVGTHGISLKLVLMDHEHGSPESVRKELEKQATRAANTLKDVAELAGVSIDKALDEQALEDNLLDTLGDITFGGLTEILKDDKIDEKLWRIPAGTLRDWVDKGTVATSGVDYPPSELPSHIDTNFPYENVFDGTWLFSGGGGSYKVYLRVIPKRVDVVYKPPPA